MIDDLKITSNFFKKNISEKLIRNVVFNNSLRVILIPCRQEYEAAGLKSVLWWAVSDYSNFQKSASAEIISLSNEENIDLKAARDMLYQSSELNCNSGKINETKHLLRNQSNLSDDSMFKYKPYHRISSLDNISKSLNADKNNEFQTSGDAFTDNESIDLIVPITVTDSSKINVFRKTKGENDNSNYLSYLIPNKNSSLTTVFGLCSAVLLAAVILSDKKT